MPVFVYVWGGGKCTLLYFHVRLREWAFSIMLSRNGLNWKADPACAVSVCTFPTACVNTAVCPGEREISRATDVTTEGCSETAVFRLMSTGCFPGSVPHGENLKLGKRGEESNQIIFMVTVLSEQMFSCCLNG